MHGVFSVSLFEQTLSIHANITHKEFSRTRNTKSSSLIEIPKEFWKEPIREGEGGRGKAGRGWGVLNNKEGA